MESGTTTGGIALSSIKNLYAYVGLVGKPKPKTPPTVEEIKKAACESIGIGIDEIMTRRDRRPNIVIARQIAWYIIRQTHKNMGLVAIGKCFGGFDHTTIMYGIKVIRNRIELEENINSLYNMTKINLDNRN